MVREVANLAEFKAILKEAGNKLVVVDFTATWCGPCRHIGPVFEFEHPFLEGHVTRVQQPFLKLFPPQSESEKPENANVIFLKVDVDEAEDVSKSCEIRCMPTFHFYKNGVKVDEFSGADQDKLVKKLAALRT